MKQLRRVITATVLVACASMPALAQSVSSPAGQRYTITIPGKFSAELFLGPPDASSGSATVEHDLFLCTARATLDWSMSGEGESAELSLDVHRDGCMEDFIPGGVFSDDCPQGWPSLEIGETREVCWAEGTVTRLG